MKYRKIVLIIVLIAIAIGIHMYNRVEMINNEIPTQDAIRLRILANSDEKIDQKTKIKIRDEVNKLLYPYVAGVESYDKARIIVYEKLDEIRNIVEKVLFELDDQSKFDVAYGKTMFPTKVYGGKIYEAGEYEAVLVKLGSGNGENWWCVLFPPLCLVDITKDGEVITKEDEIVFDFYILRKIGKWFSI